MNILSKSLQKNKKAFFRTLLLMCFFLFILQVNGQLVFEDDFSDWSGWNIYGSGDVEHSDEQAQTGTHSLKKTTNNDPDGGYKILGSSVGRDYLFKGWIYRPSGYSGGTQDRISVSDDNFNGYGFAITGDEIRVERRDEGSATNISSGTATWDRTEGEWYKFVFYPDSDNTFTLTIYDDEGDEQASVTSNTDNNYSSFDRIVIHGGHEFYVDNILLTESITWYSYRDGSWDEFDTWTTDPSGELLEGPEQLPGELDRVIIIDGNNVHMESDDININFLEVRNGKLDLCSTSGHDFTEITGEATIALSSDNFPDGDASGFTAAGKGTVEFYGSSFNLEQAQTFNNMVVNMDNNSQVLTMLADYNLNGNLAVERGEFLINDNIETDILNLNISNDLVVENNGQIRVGEGDTREGYSIQGGDMPGLGEYHSLFHQVNIVGDFINDGSVRFTNQDGPDYQEFTDNGAAVVTFSGAGSQTAELNGITDFYNLIVDKGSGQAYLLEINSSNISNFALYGPNNLANNTGGGFTEQNPEIRKALWIRNGTLKLTGAIDIPSLSEGNEQGSRGDFTIPSNGKLWIDGSGIDIYTTISDEDQLPEGTNWYKSHPGHTGLTLFGNFRIDDGFFGTRHSAGFIYRVEDAATVKINGGVVDAATFRSSYEGGGGRTYYEQTGGEVRVRGERSYDGESGGEVNDSYPLFGITDPAGVFTMSGGTIKIFDTSGNANNDFENNGFYVVSEDFGVTGGTLRLMLQGGDNFFVHTTAGIHNLEMERYGGSGDVDVRFTHELNVGNDLAIGDYCRLHPRRDEGETIYDLNIGRNFTLGESASSNAAYEGFTGNTTRLLGDKDANIIIANNEENKVLKFHALEIDKQDAKVTIISDGRDPAEVNTTPYESPVEIQNRLFVNNGTLDYNSFSIVIDGEQEIENRGTIGLIDGPGFLVMTYDEEEVQQINLPQGNIPGFGRLVIDNNHMVALTGGAASTIIGDLHMRRGILDIGSQGITVENEIDNVDAGGDFDQFNESKMIRTAGRHSDKGVTRKINENEIYLFPLGIDTHTGDGNRYTPAEPEFSELPEGDEGYVQINNVDNELPTLNPEGDRALQYYWRVRYHAFDEEDLPIVKHTFVFNNVPSDYEPGPNFNSCKTGKVVNLERKHTLGELDWQRGQDRILTLEFEDLNTQGDPPGLSPIETGEFTAGHNQSFIGEVQVYFSRLRGTSDNQRMWDDYDSWTTLEQLYEKYGEDVLDYPEKWHLSDNPESTDGTPGEGEIAIIGWVPWEEEEPAEGNPGDPHNIRKEGGLVQCAEIIFNPMLTEEGDPAPRQYWDSYFFRPTLTLTDGAEIDVSIVSGEGTIRNRQLDPDFSLVDLGDFVEMDSSYVLYEVFDDATLNNIPEVLPNLMIAPDGWGGNIRTPTIPKTITVNQNLEIIGAARLELNSGDYGNIKVLGDLRFLRAYRWDNGEEYEGARLVFQNNGTARTLTVHGDIYNEGSTALYVDDPGDSEIEHTLNLYGNYIQDSESDIGDEGDPVLRLATADDEARIILNLLGEESVSFTGENDNSTVDIYRMRLNKGNSIDTEANIELPLNFIGPSDGNTEDKALQLENGKLILDNSANDITITSGGQPFVIPSSAGLVVSQGKVNATGSDLEIDGLLRLDNAGEMTVYDNLTYSSTGNATLEIAGDANLNVGKQIRGRAADSNSGVLKYRQSGGEVIVGTDNPNVSGRGVFEVFNSGSEFNMTDGTLTIAGSQDGGQDRAALYLRPVHSSVSKDAVIKIGNENSNNDIIELDISENIVLPSLTISGDENVTAKLRNHDLNLNGNLYINGESNSFDGNGLNLYVGGNIFNEGLPELQTDSLVMNGSVQIIEGNLELNNFVVETGNSVTLEGNTGIDINKNFYLNSGILNSRDNIVTVLGDVYNYDTFNSYADTGGLVMEGSDNQRIFGEGNFGRLEINNEEGVSLQAPISLEKNLILTEGNLNLGRFRLTLGFDSEIEGDSFGTTGSMVTTDGVFPSRGMAKRIAAGSGSFTFPIGVVGKYTPVELEYTASANPGLIAVTPVDYAHMTVTGGDPNHGLDVLDYYWYIESEGLSGFDGKLKFYYDDTDVNGEDSVYWAGQLLYDEWSVMPNVEHEENYFYWEYDGDDDITGDYTAGDPDEIPELVPRYISISSGDWSDGDIWEHAEDGSSAPDGGPAGVFAEIEPGHTVTIHDDRRITYDLEIYGILEVNETYGHNFRQVSGNGAIVMKSATLPAGRFDDFFSTAGSTIVYGGNRDYTTTQRYTDFQNLVLKGTGKRELPPNASPLNRVYGNLDIEENVDFVVDGELEIRGDLTIQDGPTYDVSNWTYFVGSQPQTITGNFFGDASMNRFYINKAGSYVDINGSLDVDNLVSLSNGIVNVTETSQLRFLNSSPFFIDTDFSASWVEGPLTRKLASGSYSVDGWDNLFPIAKNGKPRFVRLDDISPDDADWTVEYFDRSPSEDGYNTENLLEPLERVSDVEYWSVEGPDNGEAKVQLNWGPGSGVGETPGEIEEIVVAEWDSENWISKGGEAALKRSEISGYVTAEDHSDFSDSENFIFTIGTTGEENPLPVELLTFQADVVDRKVNLQWVTASEINNDYFTIQRSADGNNFKDIKTVPSKADYGYSNSTLFYEAWDNKPLEGISYYRLKQTDFDGSYEYSDIVAVNIEKESVAKLKLFPNPNRGERFYLNLRGFEPYENIYISIVDMYGKQIYSDDINIGYSGNKLHEIITGGLNKGIYIVVCETRSTRHSLRMMVQ